ncbi:GntR family transcriptional regulator [Arthrobacter sp. ERGS1:01]|uniref:GntR family transcriptional regulator n=1 Tax=Arthrobacter sp. ERGS1:01 TaxID=1704044 RepID=UPI0006B6367A|nr:GntR family transcriptional regulator [Arthrobacter sp. ERGS1:01]
MSIDPALATLKVAGGSAKHAQTGQWVAEVLRNSITDGALTPGTKLSEQSLGEVLGVSRNTLREAFAALSAERIVTRIPNRGVFVARPSAAEVREMYSVRRMLEPAALQFAPPPSPNALAALAAVVRRGREGRAHADVAAMAGANQEFHRQVVALSGSDRLDALMAQVLAEMRLVFHAMAGEPAFHEPFVTENARILEQLEAGRREQAARDMAGYLDRAESGLLAVLES